MAEEEIQKALKKISEGELKVHIRGGKIVKIPRQEVKSHTQDGIREVRIVDEDIT